MAEWKTVARLDELPQQGGHGVRVEGEEIALFRVGDEVFALENFCPHQGFPLTDGWLDGKTLTCPWHGWRFHVESGHCFLGGGDARRYEVRVVDDVVQVCL